MSKEDQLKELNRNLSEKALRAVNARQVLDNPLVKEYFDHLGGILYQQFRQTDPNDTERLGWLRMLDQANQNFEAHFKRMIENGKKAEHDRELLKQRDPTKPIRRI